MSGILIWPLKKLAQKVNKFQCRPFGAYSDIRNVDTLIISDMFEPSKIITAGEKYVQIAAPRRNLKSCYELLRHTHSILNDNNNSRVIIALREKYLYNDDISYWDIPFFHRITLEKYARLKKHPSVKISDCFKILLNMKSSNYYETDCPSLEIKKFCYERGYKLKFMLKHD